MTESQLPRLASLLQLSKNHRQSWKGIQRRSATADSLHYSAGPNMVVGVASACIGTVLLLIAFCTAHWMESRKHAYSEFVRLGLWEICFNGYFHHSFQFHHAFSGCHWVYSREYRIIWEFIMPSWFLAVQGLVTTALILSVVSVILLAIVNLRSHINSGLRPTLAVAIQNILCAVLILIAIIIFGIKAQDQQWMPHQLYNYYSWSFWLAFTSILFHLVAGWILTKETRKRRLLEAILAPSTPEPTIP